VYRAYLARAGAPPYDNTPLVSEILALRHEKARLLGYPNHAAVSLAQKMAGSVGAVDALHERLLEVALPAARCEFAELESFAHQAGQREPLAHWDIAFWAERLRESRYAFTEEALRPYFSLDRVLEGLFALCQRLFGIRVRRADGDAPVWHADVRFHVIEDESGRPLAQFYLDPYSRPANKRGGAWMADCIQRSRTATGLRLPVAHLVCNGTPPSGGVPSLMTFREVETLFHEFGHGLQHMLTTVDYRDAAGIAGVEWDAVELPSQFMENWCLHRPTLEGLAIHYETGEVLPEALFEKLKAARTYRSGSAMLRQLQFGMTDLALHAGDDANPRSPFEIERAIVARTSLLPPLPETRFLCSFSHIFAGGYAAGYYSYKWAEVLSADAFAAFEEAGLDDAAAVAATGRRYRATVLAQGGSRHPLEIFREFRGRDPDPSALLRHHGLLAA
jgi:oligopeptidase A